MIDLTESTDFKMTAGKGILAGISGKKILCGNEKFLLSCHVILENDVPSELDDFSFHFLMIHDTIAILNA